MVAIVGWGTSGGVYPGPRSRDGGAIGINGAAGHLGVALQRKVLRSLACSVGEHIIIQCSTASSLYT